MLAARVEPKNRNRESEERRRRSCCAKTRLTRKAPYKLLIALWRLVTTGEVPDGVELRPAA